MNRDSLLNKTLSPPLSRTSLSNVVSYSNSSFTGGGQASEPSWIPSFRGSNRSVFMPTFFILKTFLESFVGGPRAYLLRSCYRVEEFPLHGLGDFRCRKNSNTYFVFFLLNIAHVPIKI